MKSQQTKDKNIDLNIARYAAKHAAPYHIEFYNEIIGFYDVTGKKILEVGSDYHLVLARFMIAQGVESVVATNFSNWRSDKPLPKNLSFVLTDGSLNYFDDSSFDFVYGIALLEHCRPEELFPEINRVLKPDGVVFLQGMPIWTSALGHHIWLETKAGNEYHFNDPEKNPIDNWSHLSLSADEMRIDLLRKGLPNEDVKEIVQFIYKDNNYIGSNRIAPSKFYEVAEAAFGSFSMEFLYKQPLDKIGEDTHLFSAKKKYPENELVHDGLLIKAKKISYVQEQLNDETSSDYIAEGKKIITGTSEPVTDEKILGINEETLLNISLLEEDVNSLEYAQLITTNIDQNINTILSVYLQNAENITKELPAMLSEGDRALYFTLGMFYQCKGTIIDAGCLVGGTTQALIDGLQKNLRIEEIREKEIKVQVYDLFKIDDDYIRAWLQDIYPETNFDGVTSFRSFFDANITDRYPDLADVFEGDIIDCGYHKKEPIEILGLDCCKTLSIMDSVLRNFFPYLIPGESYIIHQDFIHEWHPYIHISMMILSDCFERVVELDGGGSLAYRCIKEITKKTIGERFGDTPATSYNQKNWYTKYQKNVSLLEELERSMTFPRNKRCIGDVLAVYYRHIGRIGMAACTHQRVKEEFSECYQSTHQILEDYLTLPQSISFAAARPFENETEVAEYTFGCDLTYYSNLRPENIIDAFDRCAEKESTLLLLQKRHKEDTFIVWNEIERRELHGRVAYEPYFSMPTTDPKKRVLNWIERGFADIQPAIMEHAISISAESKKRLVLGNGTRNVLFFTAFHPSKQEGNSVYMRYWIRSLADAGYAVHLVYYPCEGLPSEDVSSLPIANYHVIPCTSKIAGRNQNGLNVHVDDWCGGEVLEYISTMCEEIEFDSCIINYAFFSAVFNVIPPGTRKILLTHDVFTDRNKHLLAQGFPEASWISLIEQGEREACQRADTVIAIQDEEARYIENLSGCHSIVISPVFPVTQNYKWEFNGRLKVGYAGSPNFINECNVADFLNAYSNLGDDGCEFLLAGGVSCNIQYYLEQRGVNLDRIKVTLLGRVGTLDELYEQCDVVINPERGGTGLKIKTLEALAASMPFTSTIAATAPLMPSSEFHKAKDIEELAKKIVQLSRKPELLPLLKDESVSLYKKFCQKQRKALDQLYPPHTSACNWKGPVKTIPNDSPTVSIICPFYNVEHYLAECIESVRNQDYQNWILYLVDDGSPDDSRSIAQSYAAEDSRIILLHHEYNKGLGPARETAVGKVSSEFIMFLDSDDILCDGALTRFMEVYDETGAPCIIGSCMQFFEDGTIAEFDRRPSDDMKRLKGNEAISHALAYTDYIPIRAWGIMIETNIYRGAQLKQPPLPHEDIPVIPLIYRYAGDVVYISDVVIKYRFRQKSITQMKWTIEKLKKYRQLWPEIENNIRSLGYEDMREMYAYMYCSHILWRIREFQLSSTQYQMVMDIMQDAFPAFENNDWLMERFSNDLRANSDVWQEDGRIKLMHLFMPPEDLLDYYRSELN